ncbi:DUF1796 family putative cysteine peptidase [Candidatus Enterococcus ikei]|uniref:Papain-like cysteine peptidase n=1 Tax=Candidatus Enterococcus ikei TaxID=2815326 RepID=A0ABS3GZP3_9ENTE|nr:DUF1796 family putative cysteine peptidase [Enterococcus sp. DIV0869a]MBO0440393.1 hypothetical protein [Enterococcus sp. DIV0869a]
MEYENIISLGFFCSVASDLEKLGVRNASYPFDWLISSWKSVEELIDNEFEDFLSDELIYQIEGARYKNLRYDLNFYHDFDEYKDYYSQIDQVRSKYNRRIHRFYRDIQKPTLFIRYIKDQEELAYLEENYDTVCQKLCKFNKNNNILFLMNEGNYQTHLPINFVSIDDEDIVNRSPLLIKGISEKLVNKYNKEILQRNLEIYLNKQRKVTLFKVIKTKFIRILQKLFLRKYVHSKRTTG